MASWKHCLGLSVFSMLSHPGITISIKDYLRLYVKKKKPMWFAYNVPLILIHCLDALEMQICPQLLVIATVVACCIYSRVSPEKGR